MLFRSVILRAGITDPSSYRAAKHLDSWLKARGIIGLSGIDTRALTALIREMVRHFQGVAEAPDQEEAQRLRLMLTSHLDDGEFARLIYEKIGDLIGPVFTASLQQAVEAGDASRIGREPLNLFWFAHHTVLMSTLARLPSVPCLAYGNAADFERQLCEFILRGIGLNENATASHLDRALSPDPGPKVDAEGG